MTAISDLELSCLKIPRSALKSRRIVSRMDETTNIADVHFSGQPALLYRTHLDANHEHNVAPELYGVSSDDGQKILPVTDDIDSAKTIFKKIEIKVIHPKTKIIKEDPFPKSEIQQFSLSS